jgi:cob(I)alamin adenosyltransferase
MQVKIMDMSSHIATPKPTERQRNRLPKFDDTDVKQIESWIDEAERENKNIYRFVVPGVYPSDAICNICRAICRRAERNLVRLNREREEEGKRDEEHQERNLEIKCEILKYVNRLSDYLFALSRNLSHGDEHTVDEIRVNLIN